ncbi:pyridoxal phosphate-dependent aminotransferase [Streptomyces sp. NPDC006785]|uniref:pyridoxal phosphate-dependent aminotransferase n=1 Tax=unclassified Streptomyces TaxID=2593676 RepID=UPI0033EC192B
MTVQQPRHVMDTGPLPAHVPDADLVDHYAASGAQAESLLYLSLGENWKGPPSGLIKALHEAVPSYAHGYTLSPYGLPALRDALQDYIVQSHRLNEYACGQIGVAVSQAGTRAAMYDFARLLLRRPRPPEAVLVPSPGWDYAGVIAPLGYHVIPYPLDEHSQGQPDLAVLHRLLAHHPRALIVVNPQHNPTGVEWSVPVVQDILRTAVSCGTAVLVDDAYYAVVSPGCTPTNSLALLAAATADTDLPWLGVRTLGKQFNCNGWGIGALTARPALLAALADATLERTFGTGMPLQAAMAAWLTDPASSAFVTQLRHVLAVHRRHVTARLHTDLGYPPEAVQTGTCTSYLRYRVPPNWARGGSDELYRRRAAEAGVVVGRGSMIHTSEGTGTWVRLHLAQPRRALDLAMDRLHDADLTWHLDAGPHEDHVRRHQ